MAIPELKDSKERLTDCIYFGDPLSASVGTGFVATNRTIFTTAPLAGGGDLSTNRTLTIDEFTGSVPGSVPTSAGGTTTFLRADGAWAVSTGDVPSTRLISTTAPLGGGGDLSADRTLTVGTFDASDSGIVPASGGGVTNFLRADGSWVPAGIPAVPATEIVYGDGTGVQSSPLFTFDSGTGNVAIGTSAATDALHISRTDARAVVYLEGLGTGGYAGFKIGCLETFSEYRVTVGDGLYGFGIRDTNALVNPIRFAIMDSTGYVGIHTTAPTTALEVVGTVTATAFVGPLTGTSTNVTGVVTVPHGGTGAATLTGLLRGTGVTAITGAATVALASEVTGTLPVANGGTGATTLTGILKGTGTTAITGGATVDLAADVTGILPVANGGSGLATIPLGNILYGNDAGNIGNTNLLFWDSSSSFLGIGTDAPTVPLVVQDDASGCLKLFGSTSGYIGLRPATAAGSTTYVLPAADGSNDTVLTTNGSGTLTWSSKAGTGAGITSLGSQTGATQTFSGSGGITITSSADNHAIAFGGGVVSVANGGTGATTFTTGIAHVGPTTTAFTGGLLVNADITTGTIAYDKLAAMTSANLKSIVSDETGSGALVFATSPTLVTPTLGAASATSLALTNALTVPNGGTGGNSLTGLLRGTGVTAITGGATVALGSEVSGALGAANGGTGLTSLTAGRIPYGAGTGAFGNTANLFWDSGNSRLGVGTATPGYPLEVVGIGQMAVQDKGGEVFNIKAYKAVGDPDYTNAMTAALTAAKLGLADGAAGPRGVVFFPPGTYTLVPPAATGWSLDGLHGIKIIGSGQGSTIIDINHATNDLFSTGATITTNIAVKGITFTSVTATRTAGWVFHVSNAYNGTGALVTSVFRDLEITKQFNGLGFHKFNFVWVDHVLGHQWTGAGVGIRIGQQSTGGYNQGAGVEMDFVEVYGTDNIRGTGNPILLQPVVVEDCEGIIMSNCSFGGAYTNSAKFIGNDVSVTPHTLSNMFIQNCSFDTTATGHSVYITGAGNIVNFKFANCWFAGSGRAEPRPITGLTINASSTTLTSSAAMFYATDATKTITVVGAGAGGTTLTTTISTFTSATQVTLAAPAGTSVSGSTGTVKGTTYATSNGLRIDVPRIYTSEFTGCNFYLTNGTGLYVVPSLGQADMILSGCRFYVSGITNTSLNNDNIYVAASTGINAPIISGCRGEGVGVTGGVGIRTSAGANKLVITGCRFTDGSSYGVAPASNIGNVYT